MVGVGTTGDTIGIETEGSSTTTTPTSRIAERSLIAIISIRLERTSITAVEVLSGGRGGFCRPPPRAPGRDPPPSPRSTHGGVVGGAHIPGRAPSAGAVDGRGYPAAG